MIIYEMNNVGFNSKHVPNKARSIGDKTVLSHAPTNVNHDLANRVNDKMMLANFTNAPPIRQNG